MLAKESVGSDIIYRDCTDGDTVCYGPFPAYDIDFDDPIFNSGSKPHLDEHEELLKEKTGDDSLTATLITLKELKIWDVLV